MLYWTLKLSDYSVIGIFFGMCGQERNLRGSPQWSGMRQVEWLWSQPTLALDKYGGGHLPVVRQVRTMMDIRWRQLAIQVQRVAPTRLLVVTDLMPKFFCFFLCTE